MAQSAVPVMYISHLWKGELLISFVDMRLIARTARTLFLQDPMMTVFNKLMDHPGKILVIINFY